MNASKDKNKADESAIVNAKMIAANAGVAFRSKWRRLERSCIVLA